jgi:hypothetical protein
MNVLASSLHRVLASSHGCDRRAILWWLRGRPEPDLERALGVVGLLAIDRSRAVKRFKDRIRKRLQRELDRELQCGVSRTHEKTRMRSQERPSSSRRSPLLRRPVRTS